MDEIQGPIGAAYDRVIYATGMPVSDADVSRSLGFAGFDERPVSLPRGQELRELIEAHPYPRLARRAPRGIAVEAWSAILHFHDPSYPLDTPDARRGLAHLGYKITEGTPYSAYVAAVDDLKERAPAIAVPETHWFLSRLVQVGLEFWGRGVPPRSGAPVKDAGARRRNPRGRISSAE